MTIRRTLLLRLGTAVTVVPLAGCVDGESETAPAGGTPSPERETVADGGTPRAGSDELAFDSSAVESGGTIPTEYTCDGEDRSPPLTVESVPDEAGALALVVDDPDAPSGTFTHWLLWNLPAETGEIPAGVRRAKTVDDLGGARQGTNGFDEVGYRGPCPPPEDDAHTYRFTLFALGEPLDLPAGADRDAFDDAVGEEPPRARITGTYDR